MNTKRMLRMCMNWKVVAGLAVVGLGLWLVIPQFALAVLPLLLVLACPLSCVLMIPMMRGGQANQGIACCAPDDAEVNQERLPSVMALAPDERLAELRFQLQALQDQQESMLRDLAFLEADAPPGSAAPLEIDESPPLASSR